MSLLGTTGANIIFQIDKTDHLYFTSPTNAGAPASDKGGEGEPPHMTAQELAFAVVQGVDALGPIVHGAFHRRFGHVFIAICVVAQGGVAENRLCALLRMTNWSRSHGSRGRELRVCACDIRFACDRFTEDLPTFPVLFEPLPGKASTGTTYQRSRGRTYPTNTSISAAV